MATILLVSYNVSFWHFVAYQILVVFVDTSIVLILFNAAKIAFAIVHYTKGFFGDYFKFLAYLITRGIELLIWACFMVSGLDSETILGQFNKKYLKSISGLKTKFHRGMDSVFLSLLLIAIILVLLCAPNTTPNGALFQITFWQGVLITIVGAYTATMMTNTAEKNYAKQKSAKRRMRNRKRGGK